MQHDQHTAVPSSPAMQPPGEVGVPEHCRLRKRSSACGFKPEFLHHSNNRIIKQMDGKMPLVGEALALEDGHSEGEESSEMSRASIDKLC